MKCPKIFSVLIIWFSVNLGLDLFRYKLFFPETDNSQDRSDHTFPLLLHLPAGSYLDIQFVALHLGCLPRVS